MLQLPSDTIPFHFTEGVGQAWPSVDACDVREPVAQTDTQMRGSEGQLLSSCAGPFIPLFNQSSQRPQRLLLVTCLSCSAGSRSPGHWLVAFPAHTEDCLHSCHHSGREGRRLEQPLHWPLTGHFPNASPAGSKHRITSCPPWGRLLMRRHTQLTILTSERKAFVKFRFNIVANLVKDSCGQLCQTWFWRGSQAP